MRLCGHLMLARPAEGLPDLQGATGCWRNFAVEKGMNLRCTFVRCFAPRLFQHTSSFFSRSGRASPASSRSSAPQYLPTAQAQRPSTGTTSPFFLPEALSPFLHISTRLAALLTVVANPRKTAPRLHSISTSCSLYILQHLFSFHCRRSFCQISIVHLHICCSRPH